MVDIAFHWLPLIKLEDKKAFLISATLHCLLSNRSGGAGFRRDAKQDSCLLREL